MLKKHRRHLTNWKIISFQLSFLKQELDHPIIEPNFYWVLCTVCTKLFHMPWKFYSHNSIKEWPGHQLCGVTYIITVVGRDEGKWKATLILYSLGKYLYFNTKEFSHLYSSLPHWLPYWTPCFLWVVISKEESH